MYYKKETNVDDSELWFVIIVSRHKNKWIFVKHKERDTRELPWGHREIGESVHDSAKRELYEETGAKKFDIDHVWYRSLVNAKNEKSYWSIYFAEVHVLEELPWMEIGNIDFFDEVPENTTYPDVHPMIYENVKKYILKLL